MVLFGFGAAFAVSDRISFERRERTFGLLLLTELRPYEIAAGKALSVLFQFLLCLFAITPILLLPLLAGGVTLIETLRQVLNILVVTALGLSVVLFWSVKCSEAKSSAMGGFLTLLGLVLIPLAFFFLVVVSRRGSLPTWAMTFGGPVLMLPLGLDDVIRQESLLAYVSNVSCVFAFAVLFFIAAMVAFRRLWILEKNPLAFDGKGKSDPADHASDGDERSLARRPLRRKLTFADWDNPYEKLTLRYGKDHVVLMFAYGGLVTAFMLLFFWMLGNLERRQAGEIFGVLFVGAIVLEVVNRALVAMEMPRQLINDRASGMMELILTTPIADSSLLKGLRRANLRSQQGKLFAGIACHLIVSLSVFLLAGASSSGISTRDVGPFLAIGLGFIVFNYLDLQSMQRLGLWWGLSWRHHLKASAVLFALFCLLPVVLFVFALIVANATFRGVDGITLTFLLWHLLRSGGLFLLAEIGKANACKGIRPKVGGGGLTLAVSGEGFILGKRR